MSDLVEVRHPEVSVHLSTGQDGNVFMILGAVRLAMRLAGLPESELAAFTEEFMGTGSYDGSLQVAMRWVEVT